jgi:hypothetical protein
VHRQERLRAVLARRQHRVAGAGERLAQQLAAGDLLPGRPHHLAEVDLVGRVVAAVRVAGHHRHGLHGRDATAAAARPPAAVGGLAVAPVR